MILLTLMGTTEASAQPSTDCTASGNFVFTLAEGSGFLSLSPDGGAETTLIPGHVTCQACGIAGRILTGTYRTPRLIDNGQCVFLMNLTDPGREPRNIEIGGVVAFQGSVLMFQVATLPGFGAGLALRSDTLLQPSVPAASSGRQQENCR
ncbi:MAG: hypothetical protein ACREF4_08165 [Gammaproteobacteria bacterium]